MANLTLTIPDAQLTRLVNAVGQQRGVDVSSMTNAQKIAMMKQDVTIYWINLMQASEIPAVVSAAESARIADIAANLTVT